jgi:hypothetical protein
MGKASMSVSWAFALHGSLSRVVSENFEAEQHRWPVLRAYDFEGYTIGDSHVIVILRDKVSGITSGSKESPWDDESDKLGTPTLANIETWIDHIWAKLNLRNRDAAVIVPTNSEGGTVEEQFASWSDSDKAMWHKQIQLVVARHYYYIKGFDVSSGFFLPPGYQFLADECSRFFEDHKEYGKNIFIMTRFSPGNRLLEELDKRLRVCIRGIGYNPVRADDKMYLRDRNLWNNVCVYMNCCSKGIAILEDRIANEFNPNVAIEYGFMRALNKPVLLLADSGFRNLRADVIGTLREEFDITDIEGTIREPIERWIAEL